MRLRFSLGLPPDGRLLFWGMFAWEFGIGLYNLLLTIYMESLGASPVQIGMLIGLQGIARIAVTLPSGILAERFSRRRLIVWSTATTVPAVLFFGIAMAARIPMMATTTKSSISVNPDSLRNLSLSITHPFLPSVLLTFSAW